MLSRRNFLASLGVVPVLTSAIARAEYEDRTPQMVKDFGEVYRGYKIRWTGWKERQNDDSLTGQWVGYPVYRRPFSHIFRKDDKYPFLFSSAPGASRGFHRGELFDISVKSYQTIIMWNTSETVKDVEMHGARKRLIELIDFVMDSGIEDLGVYKWNLAFESKIFPKWEKEETRYANL